MFLETVSKLGSFSLFLVGMAKIAIVSKKKDVSKNCFYSSVSTTLIYKPILKLVIIRNRV